ncbi:hypothetical protein OOK41_25235 [Micromonospora sp. NBC_01655]|uniref:hypothetical protein n=1 Tax=Micromonospora sp. NBC_01655 TaxID=2975983 RepID=UPI00224CDDEE|nr:hypothetical protein [Micromonospora sp. NBC_01655]MCX4473570.1 hypothetical protein [Micromonospora sp. NBC_01655]
MTDGGRQQLPPAHRAARLTILVALAGVLVAGLLSDGLTGVVGAAWQRGAHVIAQLWAPLRDGGDSARS